MKKVITALTATAAISTYGLTEDASANTGTGAYSILSGDTLWSIAQSNGLTVDQLKGYNNLSSDTIHTGSELNLSSSSTYTVKAGDTLWGIGNRNNVSVADLKAWNNLSSDLILVNQTLTLQGEVEKAAPVKVEAEKVEVEETAAVETVEVEVEDVQESADTYTVKPGDTLYGIASEFGMTYRTLMSINGLTDYIIYPGDVLQLKGNAQPAEVEEAPVQEEIVEEVVEAEEFAEVVVEEVEAEEPVAEEVTAEEAVVEEVEAEEPAEEVVVEEVEAEEPVVEEEVEEVQPEPSNITGNSYTVQSGDTLASIANRAGLSYNDIMTYNEMDSVLIYPGLVLDLVDNRPAEVEPVQEEVSAPVQEVVEETVEEVQPEPTPAPVVEEVVEPEPVVEVQPEPVVEEQAPAKPAAPSPVASYGTNWYPHGECTWYAFERRAQLGKPASGSWGNAYNWANAARSQGLAVNNTPSVGAIIQSNAWSNGAYGFGHVGVVEQVNPNGSIMISEMNWSNGLGGKSFRTLSASQAASHNFIH